MKWNARGRRLACWGRLAAATRGEGGGEQGVGGAGAFVLERAFDARGEGGLGFGADIGAGAEGGGGGF